MQQRLKIDKLSNSKWRPSCKDEGLLRPQFFDWFLANGVATMSFATLDLRGQMLQRKQGGVLSSPSIAGQISGFKGIKPK
jgi:hypothetical protein